MNAIWTILGFIGRHRYLVPLLVLLEVLAALAESFAMGLLLPFAAAVFGEDTFGALQGPLQILSMFGNLFGEESRSLLLGLSVIGFVAIKSLLWTSYIAASQWFKEKAVHGARCTILARLLHGDYAEYGRSDIDDYQNVIAGDVWRVSEGIGAFFQLIGRGAVVVVFTLILLALSWQLLVFALSVFALCSVLIQQLSRRAKTYGERGMSASWTLSGRLLSVLSGMRTVRLFRQEGRELATIAQHSERSSRAYFWQSIFSSLVGPILEAVYIPFFVALVIVAHLGGMSLALVIAFLILMYRMVPHVRAAEEARVTMTSSLTAVNGMMRLLERFPDETDRGTRPIASFRDKVIFDDVSFAYDPKDEESFWLSDVCFEIHRGGTIALVGASGSGKSTLVNLLLGLYKPSYGRILVDGVPLAEYDPVSWRRLIGFAGQDSQLFMGTIAENIAYGRPEASRAEIEAVAESANVMEFAGRFPKGLDTEIARDGLDLSGGQRQRIALARALLIDPEILLLDEATNALDNVTEATIQRTLTAVEHKKTTVIVAHRMSTIRHADWIIAFDEGRIAEQGTPAELLRKNAAFARLYKLEAEVTFTGATATD